jgi:hypothetical protein
VRQLDTIQEANAAAGLAWLALTGLVYLVVFLTDRRRTGHGWLALQSLAATLLPLGVLGLSRTIFGDAQASVLSAAVPVACVASVHFTTASFGLQRPSPAWLALGAAGLLVAAVIHSSPEPTARLATFTGIIAAITIAYQVMLLARLIRREPSALSAGVMLAAWCILGAGVALDATGWLDGLTVSSVGVTTFAFLQTVVLARQHLASIHQADRLREQLAAKLIALEARNREIEFLNLELRRQMGQRSRQLAEALARLADDNRAATELAAGDEVAGRYRVIAPLGAGAMGRVYRVERLSDHRALALKVVAANADADAAARLAREAEILSELDHPNLVTLHDADVDAAGRMFMVMELVEGASLAELRAKYGDLAWALWVAREVAEGLAAIHAEGVIHRDLKPSNILVTPAAVKIADFGISGLASRGPDAPASAFASTRLGPLTETGIILGTPRYMAPELADQGVEASSATDVFSLGLIVYELLTGKRPFAEPPFSRRLAGDRLVTPPSLAEICPQLPPRLGDLLDRCLSPDPTRRPSANTIARALSGARADARISSQLAAIAWGAKQRPHDPTLN